MPKRGRFYVIHYPYEVRFRNIIRKRAERIEPMIQIEAKITQEWSPIMRCDRSHNFLHLDLYYRNGEKRKVRLHSREPINAIIESIELLRKNWKNLFEELQYPELVEKFAQNEEFIKRELENAKKYLLNEAKHPERIIEMRGKGSIGFSLDAILEKRKTTRQTYK